MTTRLLTPKLARTDTQRRGAVSPHSPDPVEPRPVELVPLDALQPDERNANKGTERGAYMIRQSLQKLGAGRSILLDKNGKVIAGNKTLESAADIGLDDVLIVRTRGDQLVAVMREDLDLDDPAGMARELAYADNRTGQVSLDWDAGVLAADLEQGVDLGDWFKAFELEEMGVTQPDEPQDADPQIDRAEELRVKWGVESGQLWRLPSRTPGQEHRLICGDCTDAAVVARVMGGEKAHMIFTDPPYGVNYDGGMKKRKELDGDHIGTDIYADALPVLAQAVDGEAPLYLWYADGHAAAAAAAAAGYQITAQIIWAKNHAQFVTSAHYKGKHEPCYYGHKRNKSARWHGPNNEVTLWEYDRAPSNDYHPTQKPIALGERAIRNSSAAGDIVLDGFCGSGSTIIAAENLSRQCRAVELSPGYVAVALERYTATFGIEAELVGQPA